MNTRPDSDGRRDGDSPSSGAGQQDVFRQFFERSIDPIWLFDPAAGTFVDCNEAAVALMRCGVKHKLLNARLEDLSPSHQPDGTSTSVRLAEILGGIKQHGSLRFEWLARRFDGEEIPLEVLTTALSFSGQTIHAFVSRDLTEQKRGEAALRQSEHKFRLLFENSADGILILDPRTQRFLDCNDAAVRHWRAGTKERLCSQPAASLAPEFQPDGAASAHRVTEMIIRALREGTQRFEWVALAPDGTSLFFEILLTPMQVGDQQLLITVTREISQRKEAEIRIQQQNRELERGIAERTEELVRANQQLRAEIVEGERKERVQRAIYQIAEAIHTTDDLDSLFRKIHDAIRGLMAARNFYIALYDPATDLFSFPYFVDEMDPPPAPMKLTAGLTSYVLKTGKPLLVNRESKIRREKSGLAILMETSQETSYVEVGTPAAVWLGAPLHVHGRTIGVMAVQDYREERAFGEEEKRILTFVAEQTALAIDRKRAEQALRESEAKFRALFEASGQGVMLHDEEKFLEVNPAAVRILGYDRAEEIIGKHPAQTSAEVQPGGERADILARKHIERCVAEGVVRFEWLACNPRGGEVPLEVILTRIPMGGRYIIQAVIHDISDRKKAENELLRALAREKELGQLKSNFVSMVSHEFRTPLGIIMSSAEILRDYLEQLEPEDRLHHLQSIARNTRRMSDLMEEVLLLGQFEAGKMDFQPASIDLASFCRRLVDEMLSATDRRCPIQLSVGPISGTAQADERLLRHIFTNLITNAVKYSEAGLPVRLDLKAEGQDAVWTVQDEGIGIPEPDLEWLFNAFHRGRNVGQRPGTGLGLVIVKRCVELHGGRIKVESKLGVGTTVHIRLPIFSEGPG